MRLFKKYYHVITGIFVFIVYLFTLAPSVLEIDSGELAAVQITLGIAHPTGYPLFTMAGYIFSLIPLPMTSIMQANLLAAIYCSAAVVFIVSLIKIILESNPQNITTKNNSSRSKQKSETANERPEWTTIVLSIFGGLVAAFSRTFWLQSASIEVYSLHLLLISIIVYYIVKIILNEGGELKKYWLITGVLFGLAFSNHMTTLLLIPGTLYVLYNSYKSGNFKIKHLLGPAFGFLGTLIILYSYLPIRAASAPVLNWGNPVSFTNLFRHVSGAQYQVWLFSSIDAAKKQFINFFATLPDEFTYPILIIAVAGIVAMYKFNRKLFTFFLISFVFTVLYSSNYDIKDIETYYLLAYLIIAVFTVFGLIKVVDKITTLKQPLPVSVITLSILTVYLIYTNYSFTDKNDDYAFEDYTKAVINSTEHNSIILSYQWDYFISASYYFQYCKNYRTDVKIIDKELLRRSWYYDQLRNNFGNIFKGFEGDVSEFLTALKPFEENRKFDSNMLERFYQSIMTNLVKYNSEDHTVYLAPELVENEMRSNQFKLPEGYSIVPDLFLFRIVKVNEYTPAQLPDYSLRIPEHPNKYHKFMQDIAVKMLIYRSMYELNFNKSERAEIYAKKILSDFPGYRLPPELKKRLSL